MTNRTVKQVHFLGTTKLLELTKDMKPDDRDEILSYIGRLEASQLHIAKKIKDFWMNITVPNTEGSCYFCHNQGCEHCNVEIYKKKNAMEYWNLD